jgi:mono/diheme cytochrome c family protein
VAFFAVASVPADEPTSPPAAAISFQKQVLPIFQAHCQGCHQPAKRSGGYAMIAFDSLLAGGESGQAAITPHSPADSYLLELITPEDGQAEMPVGKAPLSEQQVTLIRNWIAEGAHDDSSADSRIVDDAHPPLYTTPPVVPALDCSPDGRLIAVAGFHEVLLHRADGSGIAARLVGISERIQSVSFSPDGKRLAVAGGLPARSGELQIWNVDFPSSDGIGENPVLLQSISVTADTLYGSRWSSDGRLISVGCPDNSVRVFEAETGKQVLFQGAHSDWVLDTVFSVDNSHLISVGRDMAAKLTEVVTERFVDNITSITPGALKGGILSVARHPVRDEIVIGGADGVPKVYRVFRQTERRIGDDANLIRELPPLSGRIFSVAVSADGTRIAAGSSLDGRGQVAIDTYEFDTSLPADIQQINAKVATDRTPAEHARLAEYHRSGLRRFALVEIPAAVYAVDFLGDSKSLVAAGSDGIIRVLDAELGTVVREFAAAPISPPRPAEVAAETE